MYYTLTNDFQPIECADIAAWGRFHYDCPVRVLEQTCVGEAKVSTVFLGLDHRYGPGHPLLWETMVFGGKYDQHQDRYCTAYEAKMGHDKTVRMVRDG